jgi:hypothetical protein
MRQALRKERQEVIERMLKVNPVYQPPRDYVRQKPHRKLYIPQREYPTYNFIGACVRASVWGWCWQEGRLGDCVFIHSSIRCTGGSRIHPSCTIHTHHTNVR